MLGPLQTYGLLGNVEARAGASCNLQEQVPGAKATLESVFQHILSTGDSAMTKGFAMITPQDGSICAHFGSFMVQARGTHMRS